MLRRTAQALILSIVVIPASSRADAPVATIEDAVRVALTTNERALKTPLRVQTAEGQLERARAAFLPTLVAGGQGTIDATKDQNGRILAGAGTISLSQPLLNLPAFPLYAQARHQLESERWGAVEDRRGLAFDTAQAFLFALTAQGFLDAAQRRLDRAHATQDDTTARAEAQLNSTNDVTRAIIEATTAESQVAQAQGNLQKAYIQLSFLVGQTVTGPLTVPVRTAHSAQRGVFKMEDVIRFAESRRPDLHSSHEHTVSLERSAEEPLYRLAPTLGLTAQARATVDPVIATNGHDESAALTLTWVLYDAGGRYADRRTRKAQAESQALDEHLLRRSVATDINLAITALRTARATYTISQQAVDAAARNSDETGILYRQGLARAIELTDATASRYDAEVNLASANLSMEQAYLQLRDALGLDPVGTDLGGSGSTSPTPSNAGAKPQ